MSSVIDDYSDEIRVYYDPEQISLVKDRTEKGVNDYVGRVEVAFEGLSSADVYFKAMKVMKSVLRESDEFKDLNAGFADDEKRESPRVSVAIAGDTKEEVIARSEALKNWIYEPNRIKEIWDNIAQLNAQVGIAM